MLRLLTTLGRGFKEKIGWKRLGIAASVLIIALAITSLVHTLKGVDTGVILTALTDIAPHRIALAALCVVGAFCTLTFYDFFALRTIGKTHVPYRIAALSSFTSYTIGHNIGATVFTGGAIRFRIYSDYGLSAIDVAKICFLSGLTFWLGNLFVLGDNRDNSADSRVPVRDGGVGLLPIDNLIGRADAVVGSWDMGIRSQPVWTWLSGFRLARFFTSVQ